MGLECLLANPEFQKQQKAERRRRIEELLQERKEEFSQTGYWGKQAILKAIHLQVDREIARSLDHALF